MFKQFNSPLLAEVAKSKRSPKAWWIVPIYLLVFLVGSMTQSSIAVMGLLLVQLKDGFAEFDTSNFMKTLMSSANGAMSPTFMMIALFSTIGTIVITLIYTKYIEERSLSSVGFTPRLILPRYLVGLLIGGSMCAVAVGICLLSNTMSFDGVRADVSWGVITLFFVGFVIQGMSEEVLLRGGMMMSLANRTPIWVAVLLNSTIFAILHLANAGITALSFVNLILFGIFASLYFLRTDNIWGIGAIHTMWNFTQGNIFGIEVSGNPITESWQ